MVFHRTPRVENMEKIIQRMAVRCILMATGVPKWKFQLTLFMNPGSQSYWIHYPYEIKIRRTGNTGRYGCDIKDVAQVRREFLLDHPNGFL